MSNNLYNFCGFESGFIAETRHAAANGTYASPVGSVAIVGNGHLESAACLEATVSSGAGASYAEIYGTDLAGVGKLAYGIGATTFSSFYFKYHMNTWGTSNETLAVIDKVSGGDVLLKLNIDGTITLYGTDGSAIGTTDTALVQDVWYRIDVRIGQEATNKYKLKLNGVEKISGGTVGTSVATNGIQLGRVIVGDASAVGTFWYDDVVLLADTGDGDPGDFFRDEDYSVSVLLPLASDAETWTPHGYTTCAENVSDIPSEGDTSYIQSTVVGTVILFSGTPLPEVEWVEAVRVYATGHRHLTGITQQISLRLQSNGVTAGGSLGYTHQAADADDVESSCCAIWPLDPGETPEVPWTLERVNAALYGPYGYFNPSGYVNTVQLHVLHGKKNDTGFPSTSGGSFMAHPLHPVLSTSGSLFRPRIMDVVSIEYTGTGNELGPILVASKEDFRVLILFVQYSNFGEVFCPRVALRWEGSSVDMFPVGLAAGGGNVAMNMVGCEFWSPQGKGLYPFFATAAGALGLRVNIGYLLV